ncbi:ABC transporter permease [Streptosporangium lutulentum]|uniref:Transport permease protein n=1 Tax=Streptosporangium lutulentum TaxID=1461250 RepID=A0ABT9QHC6_9ACTN|nr:ABC transporter permease [Streptosporangium lutulentum]MDP9846167.1 ABC-2 type transport system permease protein [Streptosporangium lutulentum]
MSETVIRAPATPLRASQPSAIRLGLSRAAIETRMFFREKDAVIFTFSFPIILLVIFGSIFADDLEGTGLNVSQLYVAGLIGSAAMTGFQNLGINIAGDRDDGTLKRLRGTPLPAGSYFIGKALNTLFISFVQVVILLTIGVTMFGLELPSEAARWATFVWVFVLGVFGSSLLGIAASSLPRSAKSASAVIAMPFVVLQFISGVFIPIGRLPSWLVDIASVFPLKWMCQGFRSVFLGDAGATLEVAKSYELDRVALVLGAWVIGGLVLCLMTFRWKSRRDG